MYERFKCNIVAKVRRKNGMLECWNDGMLEWRNGGMLE